ncbi:aminopeptidase N [Chitiniphilus purpureus]|uniref:Aminopeptidase N n=1 Tax=Chitiniphilus purpureus TaxID=2981137 RepID=A0ABY6DN99_9NEIS|nr:aminopeptidase N [Chitiniphilus sp. CD1]UXY14586.1 aminopeptidase N [Chitiniphilus sp. CD1]
MTVTRQTVSRLDYTPPAFLVDRVDLTFELDEHNTLVTSRLVIKRNPAASAVADAPLVLDGEALVLESVKLDGRVLGPHEYELNDRQLCIGGIADEVILEIATRTDPARNTSLMGLYVSNGNFFTQCEAEGFRKITYYLDRPDVMAKFTTTLIADKAKYPVLLSNGNRVGEGQLDKNRHWVKWVDPFRKPAYLFALVAGKLVSLTDKHVTGSGRTVSLEIYVEPGNLDKCPHAMASIHKSMQWDEARFGLEYDLDTYMIVAVSDFNMGAMENKGLNIFNTKYVLAKPETATDADFDGIESVVAHEYFHNWTGNRVTCRDWFQLSLKEGLTVYRDQEFSSDVGSRAVQRIQNVRALREHQFAEDAGPQAHPVRPDAYQEINNFYTWTVYEKGAEVVRMYATLLGREGFRKGMDLYFKRHDGQAVTCDDFRAAMADANGADLEQFALWYSQAGTPLLDVAGAYDATARTYTLSVRQSCPATPGQADKQPFHIPLAVALLGSDGTPLPLSLAGGHDTDAATSRVLQLRQAEEHFVFTGLNERPVPSLLRDFSAPVRLRYPYTDEELTFLMANDDDAFARWEAANSYAMRLLRDGYASGQRGEAVHVPPGYLAAAGRLLEDETLDPALVALMLELPSEQYLFEALDDVDPALLSKVRIEVLQTLARELRGPLLATYQRLNDGAPYRFDAAAVARRSLKNVCLAILGERQGPVVSELLINQYRRADNMTDRLAALKALANSEHPEEYLADFAQTWQDDALVMDKWFSIQATSRRAGVLSRVQALMGHPAFSIRNPNKVRALIGAFCQQNLQHFHALDGYGYAFAADRVIELDRLNPQIAARLAACFNRWPKLEPVRRALMKGELERIAASAGLSSDTHEIVSKALQQ